MKVSTLILISALWYFSSKCPFITNYLWVLTRLFIVNVLDNDTLKWISNKSNTKSLEINPWTCNVCNSALNLWYTSSVYYKTYEEDLLHQNVPLVVNSVPKPIANISQVLQLLHNSYPCNLITSMTWKSFKEILKTAEQQYNDIPGYYVHFKICDLKIMKEIRYKYLREPLLTNSLIISSIRTTWVFLNKNYNSKKWISNKIPAPDLTIKIYHQIFGRSRIRLKPQTKCLRKCRSVLVNLAPGQILIYNSFWSLFYKPYEFGPEPNFAFLTEHYLLNY